MEKLELRVLKAESQLYDVPEEEKRQTRRKIMKELNRNKPSKLTTTEYFTAGHDVVTSLYDENIEKLNPGMERVSFFFCGVGDARNMLQTLITIFA
jgi:hypothetical protein